MTTCILVFSEILKQMAYQIALYVLNETNLHKYSVYYYIQNLKCKRHRNFSQMRLKLIWLNFKQQWNRIFLLTENMEVNKIYRFIYQHSKYQLKAKKSFVYGFCGPVRAGSVLAGPVLGYICKVRYRAAIGTLCGLVFARWKLKHVLCVVIFAS